MPYSNYPGPNPTWGELYQVRELPLEFILLARQLSPQELAEIRFTSHWLRTWKLTTYQIFHATKKGALVPVERWQVRGAVTTFVYDGNSLLRWVAAEAHIKWGRSRQQARDLYRMLALNWAQRRLRSDSEPFTAAIMYLKAYAALDALEQNFPESSYTHKARHLLQVAT